MIASARNLNAKITEIPVDFFKEPEGRISHQKRNGWMTPFRAGWGTLRVTTTFSFDRLLTIPGAVSSLVATVLCGIVAFSPNFLKSRLHLGLMSEFLLLTLSIVGALAFAAGNLVHFIYYKNSKIMEKLSKQKYVERFFNSTVILFVLTLILYLSQVVTWASNLLRGTNPVNITANHRIIDLSLFLTSLSISSLSILIVSMVSNYLQKLKKSQSDN
jgi:hypothetical protein